MSASFHLANLERVLNWATEKSLWYYSTGSGCCADEVLNAFGCRYDLERFGCTPQLDPKQADLLIVNGLVTKKLSPFLRSLYDAMLFPKFVLSVGACANNEGLFCRRELYTKAVPIDRVVPVDVYVPGCPPRPEAVMEGILKLQSKLKEGHVNPPGAP